MLPGYAANNDSRMSNLVLPSNDAMIAVSVHTYDPQDFCMSYSNTQTSVFSDTKFVQDMFNLVANTFVKKNIPVILANGRPQQEQPRRTREAREVLRQGRQGRAHPHRPVGQRLHRRRSRRHGLPGPAARPSSPSRDHPGHHAEFPSTSVNPAKANPSGTLELERTRDGFRFTSTASARASPSRA
jgi:hypothetical protein